MTTKREKLQNKIEAFLKERKNLDEWGCLAKATEEEVNELDDIIELLLDLKYQRDYDRWLPISYDLTNISTHEIMHYRPVPKYENKEDIKHALSVASLNANIANDKLRQIIDMMEMYDRREKEEAENSKKK